MKLENVPFTGFWSPESGNLPPAAAVGAAAVQGPARGISGADNCAEAGPAGFV